MIFVRLMGGLGNQMFQYAFARRMEHEHQVPVMLDLTWFTTQTKRTYELSAFPVTLPITMQDKIAAFEPNHRKKLTRRLRTRILGVQHSVIRESEPFRFTPEVVQRPVQKNALFIGYWQNETYFRPVEKQIRQDFSFRRALTSTQHIIAQRIEAAQSVSVHIRRGDYAHEESARTHHGLLPTRYYDKAMALVSERMSEPRFFVFSDEPEWARSMFADTRYTVEIVGDIAASEAIVDLHLISLCRHHIIANSTFSWWGAWLSSNPEKMVFAPSRWLAPGNMRDGSDILPNDWYKVDIT
jgi:hypothetical protein